MSDPAGGLQPFLELDARRRASFGKIGRPEHRLYLVDVEPDGTIILRPAVVVPASTSDQEARFLGHPDLAARIEANRADPSRLVKRPPRRKEASA